MNNTSGYSKVDSALIEDEFDDDNEPDSFLEFATSLELAKLTLEEMELCGIFDDDAGDDSE